MSRTDRVKTGAQSRQSELYSVTSIRALLRAWHNPAALRKHPLLCSRLVQQRQRQSGESDLAALRQIIEEAIEHLRPPGPNAHPADRAWRGYRALTGCFLEGRALREVAAELCVEEVTCRRALRQALEALADTLRKADARLEMRLVTVAPHPVDTAPTLHGPLVAREEALRQIESLLSFGCRRIAVHGLPGVGKTRLLAQLAHSATVRALFPDGVLWAGLGPHPDLPGILMQWGLALGLSQNDLSQIAQPQARAQVLRQQIAGRRMLLALNDVWQLDHTLPLLIGDEGCAVALTTRRPDLAADFTEGPGCLHLPELSETDSLRLLKWLAPEVNERFPEEMAHLARASGGLPLTLTLIGRFLRHESHAGQTRRIHAALRRLRNPDARLSLTLPPLEAPPDCADRPLSLHDVLTLSLGSLKAKQRQGLMGLAILPPKPATFDEPTAIALLDAVMRCAEDDEHIGLAALDALVDAGLVEHQQNAYSLHPAITEALLAHEEPAAHQARQVARRALVKHIGQQARQSGDCAQLPLAAWPLILAGVEAAVALGEPAMAAELSEAVSECLLLRGRADLAESLLQTAEAGAGRLTTYARSLIEIQRGWLLLQRGEVKAAIAHLEKAAHTQSAAPQALPCALTALAQAQLNAGYLTAALTTCEQGLALPQASEHPNCQLRLLILRSSALGNLGRYDEADAALRAVLAEAEQSGQIALQIRTRINLGTLCRQVKRYAEAVQHLQAALTLARQIDFRDLVAHTLTALGVIAVDHGDYARAETCYHEALPIAWQLASFPRVVLLEHALGVLDMRRGRRESAYTRLSEALALAEQHQLIWFTASVRIELGEWHLAQGAIEQAADIFRAAEAIAQQHLYDDLLALARFGLAQVEAARQHYEAAHALGAASLASLRARSHYRADEVARWLANLPPTLPESFRFRECR